MKSTFRIERPGDVNCTLTVIMPLSRWCELSTQLSSHYPSWQLTSVIRDMVRHANMEFGYEPPDGGDSNEKTG